jgi:glycosyltransferase involved in cell wall biosynthesis
MSYAAATDGVSVVVPARDAERYIDQALRSILDQDPAPLEVIVADNGSTDRTAEIAADHAPAVTVLRLPRAGGPPTSRNAAIAASRGSLVAFLDADDIWEPGKLAAQLAALESDPGLGYVLGHQRLLVEPGSELPPWARLDAFDGESPCHLTSALLVRREVLEAVGPFSEESPHAETADWFLRAHELGVRGQILPRLVVRKRVHGGNISGDQAIARSGVLHAIKGSLDRRRSMGG